MIVVFAVSRLPNPPDGTLHKLMFVVENLVRLNSFGGRLVVNVQCVKPIRRATAEPWRRNGGHD